MPSITPPKPPAGLTASLKDKARTRRERQRALVEAASHAPARRNDLRPKLRIHDVPIDSIKPAPRRVRRAEAAQAARLDASLARFDLVNPILVDAESRIVHGHGIWEAARRAGFTEVPVIVISHLSDSEVRALRIALNRLAETGSWDEGALRLEFQELIDLGEDVLGTGFDAAEIDAILLDEDAGEETADDDVPAPALTSTSRPGDLWRMGEHALLQGDARDPTSYARLMEPGEQARMVLTDVPYNVPCAGHITSGAHREFAMASGEMSRDEFAAFNMSWMGAVAAHLTDGGLLATFIDWRSIELILACGRDLGLDLLNLVVWSKTNAGQGSLWRSQHELLPVFKKGGAPHVNNIALGRWGRWRSNVWVYAGASSLGSDARDGLAVHPTVKPRALLEDALLDVTDRGEIVLEPFAGSGSTLLAAQAVGRVCRAIEIDGPYCDVAIHRWQAMTGDEAVLAETGETFAAVAERRAAETGHAEGDQ